MAVKVEQYSDPGVVKGVERSGSVLQITSREPSAVVEASADLILSPVGKNHLGAPSVPDSVTMTQGPFQYVCLACCDGIENWEGDDRFQILQGGIGWVAAHTAAGGGSGE